MIASRRGVLSILASVPVVGRSLAGKLQTEAGASQLISTGVTGLVQGPPSASPQSGVTPAQKKLAMQFPWFRSELKSILLEQNHHVGSLDPDLAVLKSVSLNAKIYYQRQRNIENALKNFTGEEYPWMRMDNLLARIRNFIS